MFTPSVCVRGLHHLYSFSFRNLYDIHHFLLLLLLFQVFFSIIFSIILFIYFFGGAPGSSSRTLAPVQTNAQHTFFSFGRVAVRIWREDRDAELRPITFIHMCVLLYIMHSFFFSPFSPLMPLEDTEFFLVRLYSDIQDVLSIIVIIIIR